MSEETAEQSKSNVVGFYDLMFNQNRPAEAIERFAGATCRQHNPHVGDGIHRLLRSDGPAGLHAAT